MWRRNRNASKDNEESLRKKINSMAEDLADASAQASMKEQILASMSEGVILLDPDGSPIYMNPAAELLLGKPPALPQKILKEGVVQFSVRHPQKRDLNAVSSPLGTWGRLIVIQDVTETRRIEAVRSDFVANVSHELKTPIAGITASAETLELSAKEDPASVEKFAASLLKEARKLSRIVDDLLDLARLEQESSHFETIDLSAVVEAEVARIEDFATRKSLKLQSQIQPAIEVLGDHEDLSLAIRNLLVNAVRYTEEGGVSISLITDEGSTLFSVTDTGVGIPDRDLTRVFERFYRVDKARARHTGGTGLGLSIVRHVVEGHGGEVRAESELGRGSTFTLTLPIELSQ